RMREEARPARLHERRVPAARPAAGPPHLGPLGARAALRPLEPGPRQVAQEGPVLGACRLVLVVGKPDEGPLPAGRPVAEPTAPGGEQRVVVEGARKVRAPPAQLAPDVAPIRAVLVPREPSMPQDQQTAELRLAVALPPDVRQALPHVRP